MYEFGILDDKFIIVQLIVSTIVFLADSVFLYLIVKSEGDLDKARTLAGVQI